MEQNTIKLNNLDLSNKKLIPTFRYITQSSHPAQQKHSLSLSASVPLWLPGYTLGVGIGPRGEVQPDEPLSLLQQRHLCPLESLERGDRIDLAS